MVYETNDNILPGEKKNIFVKVSDPAKAEQES